MDPLLRIEIPAENLKIPSATLIFLAAVFIVALWVSVQTMLLPSLKIKPLNILATSIPVGIIIFLSWASIFVASKNINVRPLVIEMRREGIFISQAKKIIPYSVVKVATGNLEAGPPPGLNLGPALVFQIQNIEEYFEMSFMDQISPTFNTLDAFKIPLGERGISESQSQELTQFLEKIN